MFNQIRVVTIWFFSSCQIVMNSTISMQLRTIKFQTIQAIAYNAGQYDEAYYGRHIHIAWGLKWMFVEICLMHVTMCQIKGIVPQLAF